jgi:phage gpG-like protein
MAGMRFTSNAEAVASGIRAKAARALDLSEVMYAASIDVMEIATGAIRSERSPDGTPYTPISEVTIMMRYDGKNAKRFRSGAGKLLRGATGQLYGSLFTSFDKSSITLGNGARSEKGFPYWLSQQFGAIGAGRGRKVNIPARPFFPIVDNGAGFSVMQGGAAGAWFAEFKRAIARYITSAKP